MKSKHPAQSAFVSPWAKFCLERAPLRGMSVVAYADYARKLRADYGKLTPPSRLLGRLVAFGAWS